MEEQSEQKDITNDKPNSQPPEYTANTAVYTVEPVPSQTVVHVSNAVPSPPDYLVFSICVTICCCLPFGIVALIKSSEVRTRASMGDLAGAQLSSAQARKWSRAGLFTGLAIIGLVILSYVIVIIVAPNSYYY